MKKRFYSTKLFKMIIVVAVCGLLVFLNPAQLFNPFRTVFSTAISPFQKIAYLFSLKVENAGNFLASIGKLKKENEKLTEENQRLQAENAQIQDLRRQKEILENQLNLLPREKYELENAYVIASDPSGRGNWIDISKGSQNGIKEGMSVIISQGILIGKIEKAELVSSRVALLSNPASRINAMTAQSGSKGIIKGEYGLGLILDIVSQNDILNKGDDVITSGLGGEIPRGIYIGKIKDVRESPDKLFWEAVVISPLNLSSLEVVSVIKIF